MTTVRPSLQSSEQATLRERASNSRENTARVSAHSTLKDRFSRGREFAALFDFSPFSIIEVGRIYELTRNADEWWGSLGNMPLCAADGGLSPVGWFIEFEEERMAFLRDRCVDEIARRVPSDAEELSEILRVRIMHELDCNGRIATDTEPGLLVEALKAWG